MNRIDKFEIEEYDRINEIDSRWFGMHQMISFLRQERPILRSFHVLIHKDMLFHLTLEAETICGT
jgi:hypothetical protein